MTSSIIEKPIKLKNGVLLPSRIMKSAMSEALATPTHAPSLNLIRLYKKWGQGGQCLLVSGNIMVDRSHLGEPGNVVIDDERDLPLLKQWASSAQIEGCHLWGQLNHPGKQSPAFLTPSPVSASSISLNLSGFNRPKSLTEDEIWEVIDKFANSANILKKAGFKGVQIHGAHGYLISQFLSPIHNQRQDKWGGDIENRSLLVKNVYLAIRKRVGAKFPIGIKINSSDFQEGGFNRSECIKVIQSLSDLGIDHVEISGGNYESPSMMGTDRNSTKNSPPYFVEFASHLKTKVDVPIAVTGGFRTASIIKKVLQQNETDMVGIARPFVLYPALVKNLIHNKNPVFEVPYRISTGIRLLDRLLFIQLTWYTRQIQRLSSGYKVSKNLHPMFAALGLLIQSGRQNFRRTRA